MVAAADLGLVVGGLALFGVHDILSAFRVIGLKDNAFTSLVNSRHRRACVDAIAWLLFSLGMIRSLQGTRSWAHDDDIRAVIAAIAGVIWATTPGVWRDKEKTHHVILDSSAEPSETEKSDYEPYFDLVYYFFRMIAFFGGFIALAFVAARGKSDVDRKMAFAGAIVAGFGLYVSRLTGYHAVRIAHGASMFIELVGWGLLAGGFLANEVDGDPHGFNMP